MATMFEALGSERTLADHLLPLLSSLLTIVHTSHMKEKGPELKSLMSKRLGKSFNDTRCSNRIRAIRVRHNFSTAYDFLVSSTSYILEWSPDLIQLKNNKEEKLKGMKGNIL